MEFHLDVDPDLLGCMHRSQRLLQRLTAQGLHRETVLHHPVRRRDVSSGGRSGFGSLYERFFVRIALAPFIFALQIFQIQFVITQELCEFILLRAGSQLPQLDMCTVECRLEIAQAGADLSQILRGSRSGNSGVIQHTLKGEAQRRVRC